MNKINEDLRKYRLKVFEKIKEYEKNGLFNLDVEDDPVSKTLKPNDVDYLNTKLINKINTKIANFIAINYIRKLIKKKKLIIKEIIGLDNLTSTNTGCIITCNHFNPFDNFALHEILYDYIKKSKRRFYKVIKEGNYSFKGLYGYFFRHCETLPLSTNFDTMRKFTSSLKTILENKHMVLIYPEQSMWYNYEKPRPLKEGAYKYAIKYNVPIVPCFITMTDSNILDEAGFNVKEYTITFSKPIYKDEALDKVEQVKDMMNKNFNVWKNIYEKFYNKKLQYCED